MPANLLTEDIEIDNREWRDGAPRESCHSASILGVQTGEELSLQQGLDQAELAEVAWRII